MNQPLLWVPTLDLSNIPPAFRVWYADRFIKRHGGRGHIISPEPGPWDSLELLNPQPGTIWYCRQEQIRSQHPIPAATTLDMPLPQGGADPVLRLLSHIQRHSPIRRLVVRRPSGMPLDRVEMALTTLMESLSTVLWLDIPTFGWDAASYLIARHPGLELTGISDHQLAALVRLGTVLTRPVVLADFSPKRPLALRDLPHLAVLTPLRYDFHRLSG
jgi:hypothetical protein